MKSNFHFILISYLSFYKLSIAVLISLIMKANTENLFHDILKGNH